MEWTPDARFNNVTLDCDGDLESAWGVTDSAHLCCLNEVNILL